MDYSPWNSPSQNAGVGSLSLLQGIFPTQGSDPGLKFQADSLPAEPQEKPKNTGVGSLSLFQRIFLTQEATLVAQLVKNPPAMRKTWVQDLGSIPGSIPWRRERLPTPVFWPREFHGLYML